MRILGLLLAAIAVSGCAAILGTKQKTFDLRSDPVGADVYLNGNRLAQRHSRRGGIKRSSRFFRWSIATTSPSRMTSRLGSSRQIRPRLPLRDNPLAAPAY